MTETFEKNEPSEGNVETPPADIDRQGGLDGGGTQALTQPNDQPMLVTIQRTEVFRRLETWSHRTQILANILVIGGLIIAGLTYWSDRGDRRTEAATTEVEVFRSQELGEARSVLLSLWRERDLSSLQQQLGRDQLNTLVAGMFESDREDNGSAFAALISITDYFDRVHICVESGRCDANVIKRQLEPYARSFQCLYGEEIEGVRERLLLTSLGNGLGKLAGPEC